MTSDHIKLSRFVTLDEALDEALLIIPFSDTFDRVIGKQWVYRAVREIGPNMNWVTTCSIPVRDLKIRKPSDMFRPLDMSLVDANGAEIKFAYRGAGTRIHAYNNLVADGEIYAPLLGAPVEVSEDEDFFHLSSNADSTDVVVDKAIIRYLKLPISDGELIIPEDQVEAISMYIKWRWGMRNRIQRYEQSADRADWISARNSAISNAKMPSQLEFTEIARKFNSLIHQPRFKTF